MTTTSIAFVSDPPPKSCVELYRQRVGRDALTRAGQAWGPDAVYLTHPDGRAAKISGDRVRLNDGRAVLIKLVPGRPGAPGKTTLRLVSNDGVAFRHAWYVLWAHGMDESNGDFFWDAIQQSDGTFVVESAYQGGGWVLGYDQPSDRLLIVQRSDPRAVRWTLQAPDEDVRNQHKALAMMVRGHGLYQGNLEPVEACVLPPEARGVVNAGARCETRDVSGVVLNSDAVPTVRGNLNMDREVASADVRRGQGVFPAGGCAIVNVDRPDAFRRAVQDAGAALGSANERELVNLATVLGRLNQSIARYETELIPAEENRMSKNFADNEAANAQFQALQARNASTVQRLRAAQGRADAARAALDKADRDFDAAYWRGTNAANRCQQVLGRARNQGVSVFEHCWYWGWRRTFNGVPSSHTATPTYGWVWRPDYRWIWWRWEETGVNDPWFWNNISSIIVPDGLKVTLYTGRNFTGDSTTITDNAICLVNVNGKDFNDKVRSFKIEANAPSFEMSWDSWWPRRNARQQLNAIQPITI